MRRWDPVAGSSASARTRLSGLKPGLGACGDGPEGHATPCGFRMLRTGTEHYAAVFPTPYSPLPGLKPGLGACGDGS